MVFILFSQAVAELGLGQAIIQKEELSPSYLSTAFWANLVISVGMAGLTVLAAPWIAAFLGDQAVKPLLEAFSIVFPLTALSVVPRAILFKKLEFHRLAVQQFLSELSFGVVGLVMAFAGYGVWSLVGAALAQRTVAALVLWVMAGEWPGWKFELVSLRQQIRFGLPVMATVLLHRSVQRIDYFVIGRWLGSEALGYYVLAFQLAVLPGQRLMGVIRNVAFPSFVLVQKDLKRLKRGFLEGVGYLFSVLAPLALMTAVLGPWFIQWVYGTKWLSAALPLQILALTSFFYGFDIAQALFFAVGRPQVRAVLTGLRIPIFLGLVGWFGLDLGTAGVALSMTITVGVTGIAGYLLSASVTDTAVVDLLRPIWPSIRAVGLACVPLLGLMLLPVDSASPLLVLLILGSVMSVVLLFSLFPAYLGLWNRLFSRGDR
jgi:PST family polysaccharide transporter